MYEILDNWKRTHRIGELGRPRKRQEICLMGWVDEKVVAEKEIELILKDCTGVERIILRNDKTSTEMLEKIMKVTPESVVGISGVVERQWSFGLEVTLKGFKIFNLARQPFPLDRGALDIASVKLLPKRHLTLRSPVMTTILKLRANILKAIRDFSYLNGFVEFPSQTIALATDPGVRTANLFTLPEYHKSPYVLSASAQLYKQAALVPLDTTYTISPALRAEQTEAKITGRHLSDFWELDVEIAFADYNDAMSVAEQLIQYIISYINDNCANYLGKLKRKIVNPDIPFKKITYEEAVRKAHELGIETKEGDEISWEAEEALSCQFKDPFWVTDYPTTARAWYYRQDLNNKRFAKTMDLIYPEGYGEGITGGEREYNYETLIRRIKEHGDDPDRYEWYVEMFKYGMPPSAGFGMGIERFVRWICGLKYVWEATMFPRVPGVLSP